MGSNGNGFQLPCVLMDVNTQKDFLKPDGSCPVDQRDQVVLSLRRMVAWAKRNHAPVISAVDCHRDRELRSARLPAHCLDGTVGQQKVEFTLFGSYVKVEGDNTLVVPIDLFRKHQQVIFRKRTSDFLMNPKADRFISNLPAKNYVIFGLGIEGSVKSVALSLLARHKQVTVVVDACGYWCRSDAEQALRLLDAKGIKLVTVDEFTHHRLPRPIRYPRVRIGQTSMKNGLYCSLVRESLPEVPSTVEENPLAVQANGHDRSNGHSRNGAQNVRSERSANNERSVNDEQGVNNEHSIDSGHNAGNGHNFQNGHSESNSHSEPNNYNGRHARS